MKKIVCIIALLTCSACAPEYEFYYLRGGSFYNEGSYEPAISHYNKAIELNPKYDLAYYERGLAYAQTGNYEKAINDFTRAIELNPKNEWAYFYRGAIYSQKREYVKAINDYDDVIELNPKHDMALNNRGDAFLWLGQVDKAEKDIKQALTLNKNSQYANMSMAELYAIKKENSEACTWLKKAVDNGFSDAHCVKTSAIRNLSCFKKIVGGSEKKKC